MFLAQGGNLQAVPLDRGGRRVTGPAVTVATNVAVTGTGVAQFAVAANGNVAYIPVEPASLVFLDRAGSSRLATAERRNFHHPMFSPDGRRLSLDFNSIEGRNVWILGLAEGTLSRATFDRDGHDATWTPDGRFITYIAPRIRAEGLTLVLMRKPPGSAEPPDTLLASALPFLHRGLAAGRQRSRHHGRQPAPRSRRPDSLQEDSRTDVGDHPERRTRSHRASGGQPVRGAVRQPVARRALDRRSSRTSRAGTRSTCATSPAG